MSISARYNLVHAALVAAFFVLVNGIRIASTATMNMNEGGTAIEVVVFDLNGTFYNKSSKDEFYKFICSKRPKKVLYYLQMFYYKMLLKFRQINQTEFKENFFNHLNNLSPEQVTQYAEEFWRREFPGQFNTELLNRFTELKKKGLKVICATGALEVYVQPLFDLCKIDGLVGTRTRYENKTYLVEGKACKGEEKILRLKEHLKNENISIIEAYSDSKEEILDRAEKAFLIKDGNILPYQKRE